MLFRSVFGKPLGFYFFELPFYNSLLGVLQVMTLAGAAVYYVTARVWQLRNNIPGFRLGGQFDWSDIKSFGNLETGMFQSMIALFLVFMGANIWLNRYEMVYSDHGNLMVGLDYLQSTLGLPLQTLKAAAAVLAALLVLMKRRKLAVACAAVLIVDIRSEEHTSELQSH